MEIRHSTWKSKKASSGNGGLLGDVKHRPDTDQKWLCRPGSRGSGTFFLRDFPFKIGSGGTCVFAPSADNAESLQQIGSSKVHIANQLVNNAGVESAT
ncbi:unnamed protein product [Coregonus sp. 'balchen']|nr:unnamed protein product [Coregonus sp. 'balchen']